MKRILSILLAFMLALPIVFTGCKKTSVNTLNDNGSKQKSQEVIKIGVYEPLSGANAADGALELEGIQLANQLYPEVLGKKVELVIVDNKSDKVEAAKAVTRLIENEKVVAIIGSWGNGLSMSGGTVAQKAKIPVVGASCATSNVTKDNEFYFRVCFIDPFQGIVMANYAFNKLNAKKAAIIQEVSNDYSVGLASSFINAFIKLTEDENLIVTKPLKYKTGDLDFTTQLTEVQKYNPDVIFAPGNFTESALLIKQARQLGIQTPILGGDTWETDEFLTVGGDAVNGAVFSAFFAKEKPFNDESKKYLAEYDKLYRKEPAAVGLLGYDAYLVILDAIKRANSTDPIKIRDELAKTKDFQGATGTITIDGERNAVKNAIIKSVEGGKFKYTDTVEPTK